MSILAQWKAFSPDYLIQAGFSGSFYPFRHPIIDKQLQNIHSSYENVAYIGVKTMNKYKDSDFYDKYSAFLILRNDGFIVKGNSQSKIKYQPQLPGTIIIVNIHAIHHVIKDKRIVTSESSPCWIGACIEYSANPDYHQVEEIFRQFLTKQSQSMIGVGKIASL